MESSTKAREVLSELFNPKGQAPTTYYKILLLGIRDAYEFHRDLLLEKKDVDKVERLKAYYDEALYYWKQHDRERAIYYLGGALYHIQEAWLGIAEDPSYEEYLERTLSWRGELFLTTSPAKQKGSLEAWIQEAQEERKKAENLVKQAISLEEMVITTPEVDQITVQLARKAQAAGADLLLQFFLEATESL
jgi:hypothetical protein